MKKYWVIGVGAYVLVTTLNLSSGDRIFHNGNEVTIVSNITNP